jgi:hypothetical protein
VSDFEQYKRLHHALLAKYDGVLDQIDETLGRRVLGKTFVITHLRGKLADLKRQYWFEAQRADRPAAERKWFTEQSGSLDALSQQLRGRTPWAMLAGAVPNIVAVLSGTAIPALGAAVLDECVSCLLGRIGVFAVPLWIVLTFSTGFCMKRGLFAAGDRGERIYDLERELLGRLGVRSQREIQFDVFGWFLASAFFVAFQFMENSIIYLKYGSGMWLPIALALVGVYVAGRSLRRDPGWHTAWEPPG